MSRRLARVITARAWMAAWMTIAGFTIGSAQASQGTANGEWRVYGGDKAGTKYSGGVWWCRSSVAPQA